MRDPYSYIKSITSLKDFLGFLEALETEKREEDKLELVNPSSPYGSGHKGWENTTIPDFLESMRAASVDGAADSEPSWRAFAKMLYMGKIYE